MKMSESTRLQMMDKLASLKSKVSDDPLHDSGRHFVDGSYSNLTSCHHGDTGEYHNDADGEAIALLWNLWKAGAFIELSAVSDEPAPLPQMNATCKPTGYLVKRYDLDGVLLDTELSFTKPVIRSTSKTEFVPLFASPAPQEMMGIELAARFVEKCLKDYVDEFGSTDPETGTVEFPGNGDEYVGELEEIIEGIRALATTEGSDDG